MKQIVFTLLVISVVGMVSCRKKGVNLNIQQYDNQEIQNYISANGLTKMVKDTSGGDTTGMYYQIINAGNPALPLNDTTKVSIVFTLRSFDGKYSSTDTIANHYCDYIGHFVADALPAGLRIALLNDLKYNGGSMRVLIPSRMAYGVSGTGSGSKENANSHIAGNQCLDYYVNVVSNEVAYDDMVINNYIKANNLTGYIKAKAPVTAPNGVVPDSQYYYYKVLNAGTGSYTINENSYVETTYTGQLFNATIFDQTHEGTDTIGLQIPTLISGVQYGLMNVHGGGSLISMFLPSGLGYGQTPQTNIPANSCLKFSYEVYSVTP